MIDLTTLASFKAYAGVVGTTDDAVISSLITAYSGLVREYTSRDFSLETYAATFDGLNQQRQLLRQFPVQTIISVAVNGVAVGPQAAFGQLGYRFDPYGVTLDGCRFTRGIANVAISWTAGYSTIPAGVAQAVNELVGLRYELRDKQGWSSKSLAGETVSLITKSMPESVRVYLDSVSNKTPI